MFIGRQAELDVLEQEYRRAEGGALVPIYGRRRVGKTELIRQFVRNKSAVFFTAKDAPQHVLIRDFLTEASMCYGKPIPTDAPSWKTAITLATTPWRKQQRLILIFDEIQRAARENDELLHTLQELWDHDWKRNPRLMLIPCSSYMGYVERLIQSRGALFGRTTKVIHLRPLHYLEAAQFHPDFSSTEKAKAFFIAGGIPLYLNYFASGSVEQNIIRHLLSEFSPLHREGEYLLREELRDLPRYFAILSAMATGSVRPKDIARAGGIEERGIAHFLRNLEGLGYIERKTPLQPEGESKIVRYRLADSFLRFWFRFLFENLSMIQHLGPGEAFEKLISPHLEAYFGGCFETFCRDRLLEIYLERENIPGKSEVGEYWTDKVQIDVVGRRGDGWIDLGECKWGPVHSLPAVLAELESKIPEYRNPKKAPLGRRLFLHHKPASKAPINAIIHTLDEFYAEERSG